MSDERWADVDRYFEAAWLPVDASLDAALADAAAAGLPAIQVSPNQGQFLHVLTRARGARRVLEIGTLAGYSTIWMARALPADGRLVTLEIDPRHAAIARRNLERAGVLDRVDLRVGRALDLLPALAAEGGDPFDLTFIDADKSNNADYFRWALRLSKPGSLILVDNIVRKGAILDPGSKDEDVEGVRRLREVVAAEPRVAATVLQTVGPKGWDGIAFAVVVS
ncbi:MAG TPA: O-methyltransferase [Candidatus Saccharimonadaceae bacterium]|jgi:predicted O-methyltransferase YrrM|nr:O-methyltransferase [Candidatus Saccharimonadaceae bacterium]